MPFSKAKSHLSMNFDKRFKSAWKKHLQTPNKSLFAKDEIYNIAKQIINSIQRINPIYSNFERNISFIVAYLLSNFKWNTKNEVENLIREFYNHSEYVNIVIGYPLNNMIQDFYEGRLSIEACQVIIAEFPSIYEKYNNKTLSHLSVREFGEYNICIQKLTFKLCAIPVDCQSDVLSKAFDVFKRNPAPYIWDHILVIGGLLCSLNGEALIEFRNYLEKSPYKDLANNAESYHEMYHEFYQKIKKEWFDRSSQAYNQNVCKSPIHNGESKIEPVLNADSKKNKIHPVCCKCFMSGYDIKCD